MLKTILQTASIFILEIEVKWDRVRNPESPKVAEVSCQPLSDKAIRIFY